MWLPTAPWRYSWSARRAYTIGNTATPKSLVKPTCATSPSSRTAWTMSRSYRPRSALRRTVVRAVGAETQSVDTGRECGRWRRTSADDFPGACGPRGRYRSPVPVLVGVAKTTACDVRQVMRVAVTRRELSRPDRERRERRRRHVGPVMRHDITMWRLADERVERRLVHPRRQGPERLPRRFRNQRHAERARRRPDLVPDRDRGAHEADDGPERTQLESRRQHHRGTRRLGGGPPRRPGQREHPARSPRAGGGRITRSFVP